MKYSSEISLLLTAIEEAYRQKSWHGTNLRGSVRGISAGEAAWRPGKNRHNIWEITVHCAYWKYAVRRRILGERRGSFPLEGSNWFSRPEKRADESSWRRDVKLLDAMHAAMIAAIADLRPSELPMIPRGSKFDNRAIITGIAAHDVYHAGQIQLIKKLMH